MPKLREQQSAKQLASMATQIRAAEAMAPTHPHPSARSTKANLVLGPFAAMTDRVRDAMKAATS